MKLLNAILTVLTVSLLISSCMNQTEESVTESEKSLIRSTPEAQGVDSDQLITFLDSINASGIEFHGLMVLRHGQVVTETWWKPYKPELKHQLYSLSKSFTSTAVGFAVQEGLLTVEDTVYKFFPEYEPESIGDNLANLKIKHLLTMSTGHVGNTMTELNKFPDEPWVKTFLSLPIENEPGSIFLYNTAATFMLSAIIQKISGNTVEDFLQPRFFEPLGIEDKDWMMSPNGINTGGFGFRTTLESVAKLGQFNLQKGKWHGQQLLNEEWISSATSKQINSSAGEQDFNAKNDWAMGYGYQYWRNTKGGYRADGAFGQYSIVLPEYDAVIAINSQSMDMGATMKLVWDYLLPAFKDQALAENPESNELLREKLSRCSMQEPLYRVVSTRTSQISGKTFELEPNDLNAKSVRFDFYENIVDFTLSKEGEDDFMVQSGIHDWVTRNNQKTVANYLFPSPYRLDFPSKIGAIATWNDLDTLVLTWQFIETVHGDQLICTFDDAGGINIKFINSVAGAKGEEDSRKPLIGRKVD